MESINIDQEIKDLQVKIAALEEIWKGQDERMTTGEYELEQLNKGIEQLKRSKQQTDKSYLNIIEREKNKNYDIGTMFDQAVKETYNENK